MKYIIIESGLYLKRIPVLLGSVFVSGPKGPGFEPLPSTSRIRLGNTSPNHTDESLKCDETVLSVD